MCKDMRRFLGLLLLVGLAAGTLAACSLAQLPSPLARLAAGRGASGSIVYIGDDFNVYTMDADGDNQSAVTEDAVPPGADDSLLRTYHLPTWSPGGKIAFSQRSVSAEEGSNTAVFVADAEGEAPQRVFQEEGRDPIYLYWSPSGERLTILASGSFEGLGLWLVEEEGAAREIDGGQPYYWSWSPDGSSLLAHVGGATALNPRARLSRIDIEDDSRDDWPAAPLIFQAPDHSPEGERVIVAAATPGGGAGLMLFSQEGDFEALIAETARPVAFSWSPNGRYVAYLRHIEGTETGFGELTILELREEGGADARPLDLPPTAGFFWSPGGERLAVLVPELSPSGGDQNIRLSRQENTLFFRLYVVEAATGEAVEVTTFRPTAAYLTVVPFFDQYDRSSTMWSPDGSDLVYTARGEDGSPGVYRLEASAGAEPELLAAGRLAFWSLE